MARQVRANDFQEFDSVLAMDVDNLHHLESAAPSSCKAKVQLQLSFSNDATRFVRSPYFGDARQGFEKVLDPVEDAYRCLLEKLQRELFITKTGQ